MRFKLQKRSIIKIIASCMYIFASSIILALSCISVRDYKLDRIAYELNDYNKRDYYNGFNSPILKIHQESKESGSSNRSERYDDVFDQFYYNSFVKHLRQYATNDIHDELIASNIKVFCQRTYFCRNAELPDGGHYVDYGIFSSYYGDKLFESRPLGDPRSHAYFPYTDCVTFAYISDSLADSLIAYYNKTEPEAGINNYIDLIFKRPVLPITALKEKPDGTTEEYKLNVSINNILYGTRRHAYRISELYGDSFALIDLYSYGKKTRVWADLACELDLKVDPFGTKNVLQGLEYFGYNPDNTTYEFYKYNYKEGSYQFDKNVTEMYKSSFKSNISNVLFYCLLIIFVGAFFILDFMFIRNDEEVRKLVGLSFIVVGVIFGVITCITYFYPLWAIGPMIMICGGIIINFIKKRKSVGLMEDKYFEINI